MEKLNEILQIEKLKGLLPFLDSTAYVYGMFLLIFVIIFVVFSAFVKSANKKNHADLDRQKPNLVEDIIDTKNVKISEDNEFVDVLVAIEEEMTAIRELYVGGYISKGVYISETDRLYEKAKIFGI